MRKAMLKIHRWLAIPLGVFISILCLTGAILVFQDEIIHGINRKWYHLDVPPGAKHLEDSILLARVLDRMPDGLTLRHIEVSEAESAPATAMVPELGHVDFLVNPYTGEVYGKPKGTDFFATVKKIHRFLLNQPKNYQGGGLSAGRVIMGISAIGMSLILLSGIFLWWPKNRKMLKSRLSVSTGKGWRRFVYDSHVSLGIYAIVFLLLMSLTGPAWSFKWYNSGAKAVLGYQETQVQHGPNDNLGGPVSFMETAPEVRHSDVRQAGIQPSGNFHFLLQSLHFGRWGGWLTKILYFLAAIIGTFLPWSGYYMWWKRTHAIKKT